MSSSSDQARTELAHHLRARWAEIEEAATTRIHAISDPNETADPEYMEGLRTAVGAALDYAIAALENGEDIPPPIPTALLSQARLAARNRVPLDVVLRRYFAGYTLMGDFLIEEAHKSGVIREACLQRALRDQALLFDGVVAAVSEEHSREGRDQPGGAERQRAERVKRLLAGELGDTSSLGYELGACWHLGVILVGPQGAETARSLATALDRSFLSVCCEEDLAWAWLGGRRRLDPESVRSALSSSRPSDLVVTTGEPGKGTSGWRLSHRQAKAALPIALRNSANFTRYADIALLTSMLCDDLLVASLRSIYLDPLRREREEGEVARETLRAYFDAECNVSSAAAALGVSRQAVGRRLRAVEECLGQPLSRCSRALEAALHLELHEGSRELPAKALSVSKGVSLRPLR